MFRPLLLALALLALTASPLPAADDPSAFTFNKRSEIKASEFGLVALDISAGALYFTVDRTRLFYKPDAGSTSERIATLTSLLAELRRARLVVVTYCDKIVNPPERYPGEIYFPAVAPLKDDGAFYRPVGGFWLRY